jgi:hypothetical protein
VPGKNALEDTQRPYANERSTEIMPYQTPKPMNKSAMKSDISFYERGYKSQTNTLSQFFHEHVKDSWDLAELTPAEVLILQENCAKKPLASLIVVELKKR